jgi:hypothetical protein|tara:strand:+ start:478040 stop:478879 length:840 start_codon:yes stop_codon:yes gene_type:complete
MTRFKFIFIALLGLSCVSMFAHQGRAQNSIDTHNQFEKNARSLYLEQAYDHFKVSNSRIPHVSKRGIELYIKNDFINRAYEFLGERGKDVNVNDINAVIVELKDNKNLVHFLGEDVTGGIKGIFGVEFKGKKPVYVHFPKVADHLKEMYEVYLLAQKSVKGPCKLEYNTIVIKDGPEFLTYNVVAQPHKKSVIMGGHFLLRILKENKKWKIEEYRPFDTLCVPVNKRFADKEGRISVNYGALPHEVHAFLSLQYEQPLLINTGADKWDVSMSMISRAED